MVVRQFECDICGAEGKISIKGTDVQYEDIVHCPVCGSDIWDEDEHEEIDEE